jgi:hypothetical protein
MAPKLSTHKTAGRISRLDYKIRSADERLQRGSIRKLSSALEGILAKRQSFSAHFLKYFDVDAPGIFLKLPTNASKHIAHHWLIELEGLEESISSIRIEIAGDVVLGVKREGGKKPDLDLAPYGAHVHGVSGEHALIRPSKTRLYLIDLQSKNGTRLNSVPIGAAAAKILQSGDVISLGALSFSIKIVVAPNR